MVQTPDRVAVSQIQRTEGGSGRPDTDQTRSECQAGGGVNGVDVAAEHHRFEVPGPVGVEQLVDRAKGDLSDRAGVQRLPLGRGSRC